MVLCRAPILIAVALTRATRCGIYGRASEQALFTSDDSKPTSNLKKHRWLAVDVTFNFIWIICLGSLFFSSVRTNAASKKLLRCGWALHHRYSANVKTLSIQCIEYRPVLHTTHIQRSTAQHSAAHPHRPSTYSVGGEKKGVPQLYKMISLWNVCLGLHSNSCQFSFHRCGEYPCACDKQKITE